MSWLEAWEIERERIRRRNRAIRLALVVGLIAVGCFVASGGFPVLVAYACR